MKKLVCLAVLLAFASCTKKYDVRNIQPMETMGQLRNDFAVLVDVREKDEVQETGIATPAKWIATSEVDSASEKWKGFLKNTPKDKLIVFYCAGGVRSGRIAEMLSKEGFQTANMGGFDDWKKAGLPVRAGP